MKYGFFRQILPRLLCFFICTFLTAQLHAQVINIESMRSKDDTSKLLGYIGAKFNLIQNTQRIYEFGTQGAVEYRVKRHKLMFLNDINFGKVEENAFQNTGFQHLRYNYDINSWLTWEALAQTQYNKPLKIDFRFVTGTGPRFTLLDKDCCRMFVAPLVIYEREMNKEDDIQHSDVRISSYLSMRFQISEQLLFTTIMYYQPRVDQFSDYRVSNENLLSIKIGKYFTYDVKFLLSKDSEPPPGIPDLTYKMENALNYRFRK